MPFDGRRHLRQVAELIGAVFADELDANGRSALQEMEVVSRFSPVLGGLLSTTFFNEFVLGFVWIDNGKVVGNVTFQRTEMSGTRWRISNVAVAAEYRQRGIAKALMQATLRDIAVRGGSWAILQVRTDNPPAAPPLPEPGLHRRMPGWHLAAAAVADHAASPNNRYRGK